MSQFIFFLLRAQFTQAHETKKRHINFARSNIVTVPNFHGINTFLEPNFCMQKSALPFITVNYFEFPQYLNYPTIFKVTRARIK